MPNRRLTIVAVVAAVVVAVVVSLAIAGSLTGQKRQGPRSVAAATQGVDHQSTVTTIDCRDASQTVSWIPQP